MKSKRIVYLSLPIFFTLFTVLALSPVLRAAETATANDGRQLVVVADTTASMQPALDALAGAWPGSVIAGDSADRLFHLLAYKDEVRYRGNTENVAEFKNWLNELQAAGGEDCEDAMLQALRGVARGAPNSRALVVSDATPQGNRDNLAFIMNKLVERGVNVYPLISGWCEGSDLTLGSMFALARMTGGVMHNLEASDVNTGSLRALNMMSLQDSVLVDNGRVDDVQIYPLSIDSTVTTLGVDDTRCDPWWCLTCTLAIDQTPSLVQETEAIKLTVEDPDGNLLQPGDPGVELLQTTNGTSYIIDVSQVYTPDPGEESATWEVIVEGIGDHVLNVMADSALHFDYLGEHILPANKRRLIRARLETDAGAPAILASSLQFAMRHATNGTVVPIELFDDGEHGDGEANDGVYGGPLDVRRGLWYLAVRGELADGSVFERVHQVPIRSKGFRAKKPADSQQVPGNSQMIQFEVTNDEGTSRNKATAQTYELSLDSLLGWSTADALPETITLDPGETAVIDVLVTLPPDAEPGEVEETSLTIVEINNLGASETLSVNTTVVEKIPSYLPLIMSS